MNVGSWVAIVRRARHCRGRARYLWVAAALLAPISLTAAPPERRDAPQGVAFFEAHIRPLLQKHCYPCHSAGADELHGGLRLDTREGTRVGGDSGAAVVPGDLAQGLLLEAIRYQGLEMPPDAPLPPQDIAKLEQWIRIGAPDPRAGPAVIDRPAVAVDQAREFWSFQPIRQPAVPPVRDPSWPRNAIDRFVLSQLEQRELSAAPPAGRRELIRRVYFDLLGLPPTPEEVDDFLTDHTPDAYPRLVDRLLASPQYGQRWGQHWLDVVRYAETEGFEYDRTIPGAWRYRDYVIDAFNHDTPYDIFIREQLAGDEIDPDEHRLLVAAGLQRLGAVRRNAGNQEVAGSRNEVLIERADIVGSAILGLTIGCARCHDHKFDPISQRDYYALQAYFAASFEWDLPLASDQQQADWQRDTAAIQQQIATLKQQVTGQSDAVRQRIEQQIEALDASLPPPLPTISSVRNVHDEATLIHVLRRGEWSLPGERVDPWPPEVLAGDAATEDPAAIARFPRTALARWLTGSASQLTARVWVNRIWQHHFGRGIVATANDFGHNGMRPSHPELLDHLASALLAANWQIKPIHRQILLSSTYQQSSTARDSSRAQAIDPDNRLLWRFPPRRLSAEEIRDAMLAVSGQLNLQFAGPSVLIPVDRQLIDQLYKPSQWQTTADPGQHTRRSVYLFAKRNLRLPFMEVFDQPTLLTSCAAREQSTHAPQALELLNGQISNSLADAFAARLQRISGDDPDAQILLAFHLTTGRPPSDAEQQLARQFLQDGQLREFALAMFNLNAFLYVR